MSADDTRVETIRKNYEGGYNASLGDVGLLLHALDEARAKTQRLSRLIARNTAADDSAALALARVLMWCAEQDKLSKGQSPTTAAIRNLIGLPMADVVSGNLGTPETERHEYEPGEVTHPMHTDPLCRICGRPKH